MEEAKSQSGASSRARSIAFIGLTIAIMAVSAWVTIPIGPVPFTLQMFAVTFAIVVLSPKEAIAAIVGYLALGAVGVPVFSGMRGGIGVLAGPTGGFLWGYLFGVAAASLLIYVVRSRTDWNDWDARNASAIDPMAAASLTPLQKLLRFMRISAVEILAGVLFTAIAYLCGWAQFMAVASATPLQAFMTCIAPFVVVDFIKILAAVACARAVKAVVK